MRQTPVYAQIAQTILTELSNATGQDYPSDSDAVIRAQGTAAVVEGLYVHQSYIERQLFVQTADEAGLTLHAQRLSLPRLGGAIATGEIVVSSTQSIILNASTMLTDGLGHYYLTAQDQNLSVGKNVVEIVAQEVGASFNTDGYLTFVSPVLGVAQQAQIVTLSGGSDGEALEAWRERLLEKQALGQSQGRDADFMLAAKSVSGVYGAYPFVRRRGLGSYDVAITAQGANGYADLPSPTLLAQVQIALENAAIAHEDVYAFSPVIKPINIVANVSGNQVDEQAVRQVISNYIQGLEPNQSYKPAVLSSLILAVAKVTDVQLIPNTNIEPLSNWMIVEWLRLGTLEVHV